MTLNPDDRKALDELDDRLRTVLPEEYQDSYEELQPVPMRSAGLKYGPDGKVAWDEIWDSFCDLAMAGGPPHKGTLLESGRPADIDAQPDRYREVTEEICRGIAMAANLETHVSPVPGWVRVVCFNEGMAGWLLRAIVMENVAARQEGEMLDLPAAPYFRLERESKNVVTVIAKTSHYWLDHMPRFQQRAIASLFASLAEQSPLLVPAESSDRTNISAELAKTIVQETALTVSHHAYAGWLGLQCPSVPAALWMMRALVVSNILSRREETVLFVPVNPVSDPGGKTVASAVGRMHRLAAARGVL